MHIVKEMHIISYHQIKINKFCLVFDAFDLTGRVNCLSNRSYFSCSMLRKCAHLICSNPMASGFKMSIFTDGNRQTWVQESGYTQRY